MIRGMWCFHALESPCHRGVYYEGAGLRNLFFASDGAQLYGHVSRGQYASDLTLGWSREFDATEDLQKSLARQEGTVHISQFQVVQWLLEWNAGQYRAGISYLGAQLGFRPADPQASAARFDLDAALLVFSLQAQSEFSLLTAEYLLSRTQIYNPVRGRSKSHGDGAYVQCRRSLTSDWAAYLLYNLSFLNRSDRDGREYASTTGWPRYSRFSSDHVLGMQWTPTVHWGLFVEYHDTDGTTSVRAVDNQGRELQRYSQTTLAVLAYQFRGLPGDAARKPAAAAASPQLAVAVSDPRRARACRHIRHQCPAKLADSEQSVAGKGPRAVGRR
jgi:hypothetical protein